MVMEKYENLDAKAHESINWEPFYRGIGEEFDIKSSEELSSI